MCVCVCVCVHTSSLYDKSGDPDGRVVGVVVGVSPVYPPQPPINHRSPRRVLSLMYANTTVTPPQHSLSNPHPASGGVAPPLTHHPLPPPSCSSDPTAQSDVAVYPPSSVDNSPTQRVDNSNNCADWCHVFTWVIIASRLVTHVRVAG